MNEYISRREMIYTKRRIAPIIRQIATALPVVVVTGARQVGKSTMLRNEFADYDYVTLDDYALLEQARLDPQSLWVGRDKIIIDEAQKCPQIFHAIKLAVDASDRRKQFIISGSANLYLMEKVTESLAGRAIYVDLLPMTFGEAAGIADPGNFQALWQDDFPQQKPTPPDVNLPDLLLRGFMPPVMTMQSHNQVLTWLDGYVKTYLERD
jgi:predicted AAA+ superfamily ATPase